MLQTVLFYSFDPDSDPDPDPDCRSTADVYFILVVTIGAVCDNLFSSNRLPPLLS
jgi:hypothetical protein